MSVLTNELLKSRFIEAGLSNMKRAVSYMDPKQSVHLIFDGHKVHHKTVRAWESLGWLEREHATSSLWFVRPVAEREGWEA